MLEKIPHAIGEALRSIKPGQEAPLSASPELADMPITIELTSPAFGQNQSFASRFTADGPGVSPPLNWTGVPPGAVELLLIVEDADSPTPHPLVHAIAHGLPPENGDFAEGALGAAASEGRNSFLKTGWLPPDPPTGHGPHRYVFQLFALSRATDAGAVLGRSEAYRIVRGSTLARGCLIGTYERS